MIGKVKKWLGIEGVKLQIQAPDRISVNDQKIVGEVCLASMREEKVTHIALRLKEQYQRGRWKDKKISEFILGESLLEGPFHIRPDHPVTIPFELSFEMMLSEMDRLEQKNLALKGIVGAAKWIRGVESVYWIEAEARVKGTVLDAFSKKFIVIS